MRNQYFRIYIQAEIILEQDVQDNKEYDQN